MPDGESPEPRTIPASVTHFGLNSIAGCLAIGALFALRHHDFGLDTDMLVLMAAAAIPVILMDVLFLRVHRRASTGLDWDKEFTPDLVRVGTKLLGLALAIAPIAIGYWAFSEYHGTFYDPFYWILRKFWLSLVCAAVAYTWFLDGLMLEPCDAYWQLGRVALRHPEDARRFDIANLYRGWLVKAFFLPLMLVWMHNETKNLVHFDLSTISWNNLRLYDFLYSLIFGIDLLFATVGYGLSLKVIDAHIRTAEPTMFGWVVALFCYQPFYSLMERQYVHYDGGFAFGAWLAPWPAVRWVWAGGIVLLITIYVLATIAFGVRFSNLTHRGILTNGPYRFTKHPAYVSKNLSWWMASIPFIPHGGWEEALRHSLLLGCINTIYFLRARTEEKHLSRDPTYVAYALWMNDHGTLRFLGRLIPFFKYKAPVLAATAPDATTKPAVTTTETRSTV